MILHSFAIEGFRQYFERQEVRFSYDKDHRKNITIITGINGAGKTSLFTAINWCLYGFGAIPSISSIEVQSEEDLFCKGAISKAGPGERIKMSATLNFSHRGMKYEVSRSKEAIKGEDGEISAFPEYDLTVRIQYPDGQTAILDSKNRTQTGPDPEVEIGKVLAEEASRYFFFDGERIDAITKPSSGQVARAIESIFKINLLNLYMKNLNNLIKDYEHKMTVANMKDSDMNKTRADLEECRKELERLILEKESYDRRLNDVKEYIKKIETEMKEIDKVNKLMREKSSLDALYKSKQEEIGRLASRLQKRIADAYFLLAGPVISAARSLLEGGELQTRAHIDPHLLRSLLSQLCCICGRSFEKDGPEYQRLYDLLLKAAASDSSRNGASLVDKLRWLEQQMLPRLSDLRSDKKEYEEYTEQLESLNSRKDEIDNQLENYSDTNISAMQKNLKKAHDDELKYVDKINELSNLIQNKKIEEENLEKKLNNMCKKYSSSKLLQKKYEIAIDTKKAINEIISRYKEEIRKEVSEKATDIFKLFLWKEQQFTKVSLDKDFRLEVEDRYGKPALQDLSSGERQILSLAFIVAMSRLSKEEAPLIMDTPFGRLSAEHRANITEEIPKLADQLILFVTDEELHDQAQTNLQPYIGRQYDLRFNSDTGCTTIVEVQQ